MGTWRPWPYAATAIVQHEWDTDHLNVWLIFKYPMDQTVKPAHDLWICLVDDVPKAVTVSAWQDEWTILLTVPDVLALPGRMTLEYEGPSESLRTTWAKQWEPWGPTLSKRVPYLWEDILVVDTVNKRVGIQPGVVAAAAFGYALTIVSPDGNDQLGLYQSNSNAWMKWTDGDLYLITDEGVNTSTIVRIQGKGTGYGNLRVYDENSAEWITFYCSNGRGYLAVSGASEQVLALQPSADIPVQVFRLATESETEQFQVTGWKAGDTEKRTLDCQISPNANNTALWSGVGDYVFDGNIRATGRLVSGTLTHSAVDPTDNLDVSGVNIVLIDCSANDVVIGAFIGGVNGQTLHVAKTCDAAHDVTLEHNEGTGNQNIFLHAGIDETLRGEYGGWTLVCNGTSWFDISHSKHV